MQQALGSTGVGGSRSVCHPISGPLVYECYKSNVPYGNKQGTWEREARLAADVVEADATAHSFAEEEAIIARILQNRQRRNTHALTREQNRAVRAMAGLPPKEEKEDIHGSDNIDYEQIWLDLYCVFDRYFREMESKGVGKGKDIRG